MQEAARADRPAAVRLLMREGYPATNEAVAMAVRQFSAATLEQLLAGGAPEAPTTQDFRLGVVHLPSPGYACPYTCPVLAALHARTTQASAGEGGHGAAPLASGRGVALYAYHVRIAWGGCCNYSASCSAL